MGDVMPKARNRYDRALQVLKWLNSEFEFPRKLRLEWVEEIPRDAESPRGYLGECDEVGDRLVIRLCARSCRSRNETVETVIHEAAHAALWDQGLGYQHGPVFWKTFGQMMDAYDHHGMSDSESFDF